MTASRFQEWAKELGTRTVRRIGKPEANQIEPDLMLASEALLERLRQERWTTDAGILEVARAWMEYESPRPNVSPQGNIPARTVPGLPTILDGKRDAQGQAMPGMNGLIDALVPLLEGRPLVLMRLLSMKGHYLSFERKDAQAAAAFEAAAFVITPLAWEALRARLGSLLEQASVTKDAAKAEALYREVMRPPFLYITDEETKRAVRDVQLRAGRALIEMHRGDAPKLKGLTAVVHFIAEAREELDAALKEAEAGGRGK